jgi:predicted Fe-Mo cluster-binding NifX family protein
VKFAVTSQDFVSITGHAGKTTRFLVYEAEKGIEPAQTARLDLNDEQTIHNFEGGAHPLDGVDVLIAGSAGQCFIDRMRARGIVTVVAAGIPPREAVAAYLAGHLKAADGGDACSCHG